MKSDQCRRVSAPEELEAAGAGGKLLLSARAHVAQLAARDRIGKKNFAEWE